MSTYLRVGNSEGERRCDERCHNAKCAECDCCCGGRYHGKGEGSPQMERELEATAEEWIAAAERSGQDVSGLREAVAAAKQLGFGFDPGGKAHKPLVH